jgi:hypothetical protein
VNRSSWFEFGDFPVQKISLSPTAHQVDADTVLG